MKFTVKYKMQIQTNLSEVEISEDRIIEDFGSVENFLLWCNENPIKQKERNLLKKLSEKFPMFPEDYIKSVGNHIQTFQGHRFDMLHGVSEGGLDQHQDTINFEKSIGFENRDGTRVKEVKIEFD